jgi:hypothetical protein
MTVRIRASFLRLSSYQGSDVMRTHGKLVYTTSLSCAILGRYALHVDADGTISVG